VETIEELKAYVNRSDRLDDIISAIIYKSGNTKIIPKAHSFIQQAFYSLKQEKPELFRSLIFDVSGISPFSDELDEMLFRLEASTIFSTLNPSYKNYTIASDEPLKLAYEKITDKESINSLAKSFSRLVEMSM